jgi:metallophosphoesterase superfamily enzyme
MEFGSLDITLIRGNHDVRVGALSESWPIKVVDPGIVIEQVALGHHPGQVPYGVDVYLCGHLHPAIHFSIGSERLGKLPCFWYSRRQLVLPAIGKFTGTHVIKLSDDESAWITAENTIFPHP